MLRVRTIAADGLLHFLVHYHIDFDTGLSPPLQDLIESPFLVVVRRSPQEEFRTQPPIFDVNGLLCLLERDRYRPEIISSVDIPLDLIPIPLRGKGFEAVALGDLGPLLVCLFLVVFVVAVIRIDDVVELADLALEMKRGDFGVVKVSAWIWVS